MQGQQNTSLNSTGRLQAVDLAGKAVGNGIQTLCCSPLLRALETARVVPEKLSLPINIIDELSECAWGNKEGKPKGDWFTDWKNGLVSPEGAESFDDFLSRALSGINKAISFPGPVLIISHGGVYWTIEKYARLNTDNPVKNCELIFHHPPAANAPEWKTQRF